MPTAPKTYHYHFMNLTYLFIYSLVISTPNSNNHPTHLKSTPPPFPTPSTPAPAIPPKLVPWCKSGLPQSPKRNHNEKKDQKQASHRHHKARPHPVPPTRAHTRSGQPKTTELRTQHPRPRSTRGRTGRDAPCRSRSPEQEGKAKKNPSIKKEENCDIAIFVVRLIVAVRFPNTKVRTRAAFCTYFQFSNCRKRSVLLAVEDSDGGGGRTLPPFSGTLALSRVEYAEGHSRRGRRASLPASAYDCEGDLTS